MFQDPVLNQVVISLLIILSCAILGKILKSFIEFLSRRHTRRTTREIDARIILALKSKILPLSIIVGCSLAIREIRKVIQPQAVTAHEVLDYLAIGLFIVFALLISHLIGRLLKSSVQWYAERVSQKNQSNLAPAVVPFTSKLINILIFFIVGMIILDRLGVNIGGFLVSLGVGSLAIALAAQETLANMIAWFVILVDQPIRIGDKVRLPSGEEGEISAIGLRSTRILNYDNNLIIVPNGELIKNRLLNLTLPDTSTRVLIEFPLAYGTDIHRVRALILGILAQHKEIQQSPLPQIYVSSFDDAAIRMRLHIQTIDLMKKFELETDLREKIYSELQKNGIEFPRVQRFTPVS